MCFSCIYYRRVTAKRAAHRPSRRGVVVTAALDLYAKGYPGPTTVADIAVEAGMTPAAVYYHYATKEDILLEGLTAFGESMAEFVLTSLEPMSATTAAQLPLELLAWCDKEPSAAKIWFVRSNGLSMTVEAVRREVSERMLRTILRAVRAERPDASLPHASVIAAALIAVIDVGARAWFDEGSGLVNSHEEEFRQALAQLSERIISAPMPSTIVR